MVSLSENLDLCTIAFEIDEDERGTSSTNGHNAAGKSNGHIFHELVSFSDSFVVFATELVNTVSASKLVRVWVDVLVAKALDERLSILSILRGVLFLLLEGLGEIWFLGLVATFGSFFCSLFLSCSFLSGSFFGGLLLLLSLLLAFFELANQRKGMVRG